MARISFDNGSTYLDPADVLDLAEIRDELARVGLDAVANCMDDDTRERCHIESEWTGTDNELGWLCDYLAMADDDIVMP